MSQPAVTIHPYFKVHSGRLDAARALLPGFIAQTATEPDCLYYEFTINGDVVFCRESYRDAASALGHLANVDSQLKQMLALSDLIRLEIHGPAGELEKLKAPLAAFNPDWFAFAAGVPH